MTATIGERVQGTARTRRTRRARAGLTLVEIMVVIVIVALAAGGMTFGVGALTRSRLRSACMKIASAANFGYSRATVRGRTVRVVLDFAEGKLSIEEAHGFVNLARASDERRRNAEDEGGDGERAAVDPWEAARARLDTALRPTLGTSPFGPLADDEGNPLSRYQPQPLGDGIRIAKLFAPHEPEPRTSGRGAFYFFPGGLGQRIVVQLADRSDTIYSVELHPLTGRARVHAEAFEPRELSLDASDEERSEVEDDR